MDRQALLEQLRSGVSIDELMSQVAAEEKTAPASSELFERCALVRSFDKVLYDQLLSHNLEVSSFDEFARNPDLEALPMAPLQLFVRDEPRRRAFEVWRKKPAELQGFSAKLVDYYLSCNAESDVFTHRIFADPATALADFQRLYREADDRFDLAQCDALLRILRNRSPLIPTGSKLREALNDHEQYLRSRTLFADDYYRTVSYLQRHELASQFDRFLADPSRWIFHIFGKGGLGKTMFVRWLIARRCVVEQDGHRIPVARVDFDQLDLPTFSRWPWLILPLLAEHLEQQLPHGGFSSFLTEYRSYSVMLRRSRREAGTSDLRKQLAAAAKDRGDQVVSFFSSALGAHQVVVILDTLEEPLLHYKAALRNVLMLFGDIRKQCPGFHVVLSGRYSIQDPGRLPAIAKHFNGQVAYVRVDEFSENQSLRFLRDLKHVSHKKNVLRTVRRQTRGNPLELALFAELLQADPTIDSPAKVRDVYPVFKFAYLLDRIIKRIPNSQQDVRWLLRYAVIPRRLTRQFLDDVLAKYLPDESAGITQRDNPHKFDGPLTRFQGQTIWGKTSLRIDRAWEGLRNYAGASSWVTIEEDTLRIQPEVVNPMRALLREQSDEMFTVLHQEAARYFEQRAARENDRWAEHMAEALYHRFQLEGAAAIPDWQKRLADRHAADPVARERIAGLVLGSEFLDDETRRPQPHPIAGVMIDRAACAQAAFEVAWSASVQRCLMTRRYTDASKLRDQIANHQRDLEFFHRRLTHPVVPESRRLFLKGMVAIHRNRARESERLLRRAVDLEKEPEYGQVMAFRLALTLRFTRPEQAASYFDVARKIGETHKSCPLPIWWIDYREGRHYVDRDDPMNAVACFDRALAPMARSEPTPIELVNCLRRLIQARIALGEWGEARKTLEGIQKIADDNLAHQFNFQQLVSEAQIALAAMDVNRATACIRKARPLAREPKQEAVLAEIEGDVATLRFDTRGVEEWYIRASALYERAGSPLGPAHCALKRARYYLEQLGNARMAGSILKTLRVPRDPELQLQQYILMARRCRMADLDYGLPDHPLRQSSRQDARVLAACIASGERRRSDIRRFLDALQAVRPPSACWLVLREFSAADPEVRARNDIEAARRLLRLVDIDPKSETFPLNWWYCGEALRVLDSPRAAVEHWSKPPPQSKVWDCLPAQALARTFQGAPFFAGVPDEAWRLASGELEPVRKVIEAERCLALNDLVMVETCLAEATQKIQGIAAEDTIWHVRLEEATGHLAEIRGQTELARARYQAALRHAERCENSPVADRLKRRLNGLRHAPAAAEWTAADLRKPAVFVAISAEKDVVSVTSHTLGDAAVVINWNNRLAGALLSSRGLIYSSPLLDCLRGFDWPTDKDVALFLESVPKEWDVSIQYTGAAATAFPWEAGLRPDPRRFICRSLEAGSGLTETVMWVQTALRSLGTGVQVDGVLGPRTRAAIREIVGNVEPYRITPMLAEALRRQGKAEPKFLVLRAELELERNLKRGHGSRGLDVVVEYQKCTYFPVQGATTWFTFTQGIIQFAPQLIHIVTGFLEDQSREIHLDVTALHQEGELAMKLTASFLTSVLSRLPGKGVKPFVIVEALSPEGDYDRARQVLLRNAFCADLLRHGSVRGVLATGLFPSNFLETGYADFVSLVAADLSIGDLHTQIWQKIPAAFPPALFTFDPALPVLR